MIRTDFASVQAEAQQAAADLRTTVAIRERCGQLFERARRGESRWFEVDEHRIDDAAHEVAALTKQRFRGLHIPFHSRWRHFEAGGVDRRKQLEQMMAGRPPMHRTHSLIDLAVVSVLLDAGAGPDWLYVESASDETYTRSEGLAVASFHAFTSGLFSSDKDNPYQVDADGLRALQTEHLAAAFQVRDNNPLVGIESRAVLLRRLGEVMAENPEVYGDDPPRPGGLFDLIAQPGGPEGPPRTATVTAHDILTHLLSTLSPIWPSQNTIGAVPLGDCWRHEAVRGPGLTDGWVPFHKLSQWMTYSLLEPFAWGGVTLLGLDTLTGLPEYRNGGLFIDSGVLRLRDPSAADRLWLPGDEIIVEWRALTVTLLDMLAVRMRHHLHTDAEHLPLARVLEGGTWAAGRALAQKHRDGLPPLRVASDGTVF